jgi:hypothetical protein
MASIVGIEILVSDGGESVPSLYLLLHSERTAKSSYLQGKECKPHVLFNSRRNNTANYYGTMSAVFTEQNKFRRRYYHYFISILLYILPSYYHQINALLNKMQVNY